MPKGRYNSAEFYALYRYAYGWSVRLTRQGRRFEKSFSDRAYGGEAKALDHARSWRDQVVRAHPPLPRIQRATRPVGGSGPVPGVTPELDRKGRVKLWRAKTYVSPGKVLQKTFSLVQYGSSAMRLAVAERQRQLRALSGRCHVHPAEEGLRNSPPSRNRQLPPVPKVLPAHQMLRTTNTSGYPGVVRRGKHWTAQSTMGGKWVSQSYRIDRLGEEVALILAVWARLDQLGQRR
ncbi:hypothetical protein DBA29_16405 [Xenophilus aerolatus]|nr:hypothetical protein [Xenophilus aerolatus]